MTGTHPRATTAAAAALLTAVGTACVLATTATAAVAGPAHANPAPGRPYGCHARTGTDPGAGALCHPAHAAGASSWAERSRASTVAGVTHAAPRNAGGARPASAAAGSVRAAAAASPGTGAMIESGGLVLAAAGAVWAVRRRRPGGDGGEPDGG
jgi:MYXO-CTERM domain-containing protein